MNLHLPGTERLLPARTTADGWRIVRIHYSAIPDYDYDACCEGLDTNKIRQELEIDWTATSDRRVFPQFGEIHIARAPLRFEKARPLVCGWDFGQTPAWVPTQINSAGQWCLFKPLVGPPEEAIGLYEFATQVYDHLQEHYCQRYRIPYALLNRQMVHFGDPAGRQRVARSKATTDDKIELRSGFEILDRGLQVLTGYNGRGEAIVEDLPGWGWKIQPGAVSITERLEAVISRLRLNLNGRPALIVCPTAHTLIEGFMGSYHYKRRADGSYADEPEKNWYSHSLDALQYPATRLWKAGPKGPAPRKPGPIAPPLSSHAAIRTD